MNRYNQYSHLVSFPYNYEINRDGQVRMQTGTGYVYFKRVNQENGAYILIEKDGKEIKCLLAELVLITFHENYKPGYRIKYDDGDMYNISIENLRVKKVTTMLNQKAVGEQALIGDWCCGSKASSANSRYAHLNQIVTPNEVLRCLVVCNFKCFYCGSGLNQRKWHLDHYIPTSKNGKNVFENLRPSCKWCNMMKSDMFYEEVIKQSHRMIEYFKLNHSEHSLALILNSKDNG